MNKLFTMNGKQYRIIGLTTVQSFSGNKKPSCTAEFLYKGKWHEVKNYQILVDLRKLYDKECA